MANVPAAKWSFQNLQELHQAANSTMRTAMVNERCKRWTKVVDSYRKLLWMISTRHFPNDYEPPASYSMLLYELHYHLGVAYQHIREHKKSVTQFCKAVNVVSIAKNGCLAGCVVNSCLMTPIYARRAYAYSQTGDLKSAIRDAERAVVLDSKNPDVYCIRALVRSTRDEDNLALKDLDVSLSLNSSHLCSLILRASLTRPLTSWKDGQKNVINTYRKQAQKLNPESESYLNVSQFNHPCMMEFYDRFLFALSVPHTITVINLTPDKPSRKYIENNPELYRSTSNRPRSSPTQAISAPSEPFRCGTPTAPDSKMAPRRRYDYGEAVRKYVSRPKTAADFFEQIEKDRRKKAIEAARAKSAIPVMRTASLSPKQQSTEAPSQLTPRRQININTGSSPENKKQVRPSNTGSSPENKKQVRPSNTKTFVMATPTNYTIPVFQPVNIGDAPRMYYRPWSGDKLPVAEVCRRIAAPAFY